MTVRISLLVGNNFIDVLIKKNKGVFFQRFIFLDSYLNVFGLLGAGGNG